MNKKLSIKNYFKLSIYHICIIIFTTLCVYLINLLPLSKPTTINQLNIKIEYSSLLLILLFVIIEEFTSRYFIRIRGWIGALWLLWFSYFSLFPFLFNLYSINHKFIDSVFIIISVFVVLILSKFNKTSLYNQLFEQSSTRIILSAVSFSLLHLGNYNIYINQLWYMVIFVLLTHSPFAFFLTHIHLNYKYGFWIATGFHFFNNILATILSIYLK
jgi:hypothetical protein